MLIKSVDVHVDMLEESKTSTTTIGTDSLGPCIGYLLDFNYYNDRSGLTNTMCFIEHYSFWVDNTSESSTETLTDHLKYLSDKLKNHLQIDSFYSNREARPRISNCCLVIAGSDVKKILDIHNAFSLLHLSNFNNDILTDDVNDDVRFLIEQLLDRTIILKSIIKGSNGE